MNEKKDVPLSGRRAQAARNDQLILDAARRVFIANPNAPISAVAEEAGVGIAALYRRYRSKDELLQKLFLDGLRRYISEAEAALADEGDPWESFAGFMRRALDAGANSLSLRMAGAVEVTDELRQEGYRGYQLTLKIIERAKAAGALRPDIQVGDLSLIFEQLQSIQIGDPRRTSQLRHRYLTLMLDSLRLATSGPLPGPAPAWEEISGRYGR